MELFLIRHSTPDVPKGTCYGHTDLDLVSSFQIEFSDILRRLRVHLRGPLIYSSPLTRCLKLARFIHQEMIPHHPAPTLDDRLKEMNFGDWENRLWKEIPREQTDPWSADFANLPAPGGESYRELFTRTSEFIVELEKEDPAEVAIFCHGGVIRCLLSHFLGLPLENTFRLTVDFGSISKVTVNKRGISVNFLNH